MGYCAPEVLSGSWRRHPTACDAWAVGVMLVELLTGVRPELCYRDPATGTVRFVVSHHAGKHRQV